METPERMTRCDFWLAELEHAHSTNALVDNQRLMLISAALAFHGAIIGAIIFVPKESVAIVEGLPDGFKFVVAAAVLLIGLSIFGVFFSQHLYMRSCKRWMKATEGLLMESVGLLRERQDPDHKGSLLNDDNKPHAPLDENTIAFCLLMFITLNCISTGLVALASHIKEHIASLLVVVSIGLHFFIIYWIRKDHTWHSPVTQLTDGRKTPFFGNAADLSKQTRGWFVGHFIAGPSGLLTTDDIEVKWGQHKRGEARMGWDAGAACHTLTLLVHGSFQVEFKGKTFSLEKEGDFVIWGPGIPHTWVAVEDSIMLTLRWPSLLR